MVIFVGKSLADICVGSETLLAILVFTVHVLSVLTPRYAPPTWLRLTVMTWFLTCEVFINKCGNAKIFRVKDKMSPICIWRLQLDHSDLFIML